MPAKKVTYLEYKKWLALEPRTNGWSAFVAYDRDKCNQLLRQEYVEKFDNGSLMPPISKPYVNGESTWKWTLNCVTDVPRLSFENNANDDTSALVNMSMAIIGGTVIELSNAGGSTEVTKISSYDPLDHPRLFAEKVLLQDVKGGVDQAGSVVLDLGNVESQKFPWELEDSRIQHQRRLGGDFLKRVFRDAKPENRTFKLGTLAYTEQNYLKPSVFKVRTILEEGAQVRSAPNFGNGVVELRIAMEGEKEGGGNNGDWLYPIPGDMSGIDSCLMISNELLMKRILGDGAKQVFKSNRFIERKDEKGFVETLLDDSNPNGVLLVRQVVAYVDSLGVLIDSFALLTFVDSDNLLKIKKEEGGRVRVTMGSIDFMRDVDAVFIESTGNAAIKNAKVGMEFSAYFLFDIDSDQRRISVGLTDLDISFNITSSDQSQNEKLKYLLGFTSFQSMFNDRVGEQINNLFSTIDSIDAFVLHSLLFNSTDSVHLKTVDVPGDLVSFGTISPRLTTFEITDHDILLGYGDTHTFSLVPDSPGVKWSVQNLDGSSEGAGQINEATGEYTAPGLADITGTYKRVKVIAMGPVGSDGKQHVSKVLVSIVVRAITINPLVESCAAMDTREFTAHSMSGTLKWEVVGGGSIPSSGEGKNVYQAPPKHDMGAVKKSFTIDEVRVSNGKQTQSSLVVVKHDVQALSVTVEIGLGGPDKAKFTARLFGDETTDHVWNCVPEVGAGSIDNNGLYTSDPASQYQFVIITVREVINGRFFGDAFYIMPLPLKAIPEKPDSEFDGF